MRVGSDAARGLGTILWLLGDCAEVTGPQGFCSVGSQEVRKQCPAAGPHLGRGCPGGQAAACQRAAAGLRAGRQGHPRGWLLSEGCGPPRPSSGPSRLGQAGKNRGSCEHPAPLTKRQPGRVCGTRETGPDGRLQDRHTLLLPSLLAPNPGEQKGVGSRLSTFLSVPAPTVHVFWERPDLFLLLPETRKTTITPNVLKR